MKRAALLLSCLLCLSLFAGCSGETEKVGPASDPLGYLEKGILTMSESELLKLEDDFEKELEDDGGISYIRQFESGEYSGVFSVSYEQGKVKSLFYTIGFEENEGEKAASYFKDLLGDLRERYGKEAGGFRYDGTDMEYFQISEKEIDRLCQDKTIYLYAIEWPHGTSGQYGEEMSLLQLQYISNDSYAPYSAVFGYYMP